MPTTTSLEVDLAKEIGEDVKIERQDIETPPAMTMEKFKEKYPEVQMTVTLNMGQNVVCQLAGVSASSQLLQPSVWLVQIQALQNRGSSMQVAHGFQTTARPRTSFRNQEMKGRVLNFDLNLQRAWLGGLFCSLLVLC